VAAKNHFRLQNALYPKAFTLSFWATAKTFFALHLMQFKKFLNPSNDGSTSRNPATRLGTDSDSWEAMKQEYEKHFPRGQTTSPTTSSSSRASNQVDANPKRPNQLPKPPLPPQATGDDITRALSTSFWGTFAKTWRPVEDFAPRGSIEVSGMIEIGGPTARIRFDVYAAYDPKDSRCLGLNLRRAKIQPAKQGPRGGQ
jgi:hypothetical protein